MAHHEELSDLAEQEILALAIALEEEDERICDDFAAGLEKGYPASAAVFRDMAIEESARRHRLIELHRERGAASVPGKGGRHRATVLKMPRAACGGREPRAGPSAVPSRLGASGASADDRQQRPETRPGQGRPRRQPGLTVTSSGCRVVSQKKRRVARSGLETFEASEIPLHPCLLWS
ncbi:MAG: ferritin family protein [Geminicoccaceae bacterium]